MYLQSLSVIPMYIATQLVDPYLVTFSNKKDFLWLLGYDHPNDIVDTSGLPIKSEAYNLIRALWTNFKTIPIINETTPTRGLAHPPLDLTEDQLIILTLPAVWARPHYT